jgi:hypothetical protein
MSQYRKRFLCGALVATCMMALAASALAIAPDFSQYHNGAWTNYCAPTAGADVVYDFGQNGYPTLQQGNAWGPGVPADNGVDGIIGIPPPAAGTLANLMGTTLNGGTTLIGLSNGLDAYLEANDNIAGPNNWITQWKLVANYAAPQGSNFMNDLQTTLNGGGRVILAIAWQGGVPPGYENPSGAGDSASSGIGHAVMMLSYNAGQATVNINDPANNLPINLPLHNWGGENAAHNLVGGWPAGVGIQFGAITGTVYGAVTTQPVPEPGTVALLATGTIGLLVFVWRRRAKSG